MHVFDRYGDADHHHERSSRPPVRREGAAEQLLGLQRAAGNAAVTSLIQQEQSPVLDLLAAGGGRALDPPVRAEMEARLGHSFGDVRVHTGGAADASARAVDAAAYTVGSDVVFQQGRYDPSSQVGRTLLAHELTHVVQQRTGPVDGTPAAGGVRISDPGDRFERQAAATAEHAVAAPMPAPTSAAPQAGGAGVQRQAEEPDAGEEAAVQTAVPRQVRD